jgi:hypothetical protein
MAGRAPQWGARIDARGPRAPRSDAGWPSVGAIQGVDRCGDHARSVGCFCQGVFFGTILVQEIPPPRARHSQRRGALNAAQGKGRGKVSRGLSPFTTPLPTGELLELFGRQTQRVKWALACCLAADRGESYPARWSARVLDSLTPSGRPCGRPRTARRRSCPRPCRPSSDGHARRRRRRRERSCCASPAATTSSGCRPRSSIP